MYGGDTVEKRVTFVTVLNKVAFICKCSHLLIEGMVQKVPHHKSVSPGLNKKSPCLKKIQLQPQCRRDCQQQSNLIHLQSPGLNKTQLWPPLLSKVTLIPCTYCYFEPFYTITIFSCNRAKTKYSEET